MPEPGQKVTTFAVLPRGYTRNVPHWLIELHFLDGLPPLGIEVADEFSIGLMRYGAKRPDLDLRSHRADEKGVSRCHVMLQPDHHSLYIVDLASTNGTWINGTCIEAHKPVKLQDGDVISLAGLSFAVRLVAAPDDLGMRHD
jgi:hypothetical protein